MRAELVAGLARPAGAAGMVGGQCLDLEADKLGGPPRPIRDHVERLQAMKTGALIRFACEAGAILGRAGPEQRRALALYGERLGAAFQIADDLLDRGRGRRHGQGRAQGRGQGDAGFGAGAASGQGASCELEAEALAALEPFGERADLLREAARFVVARQM